MSKRTTVPVLPFLISFVLPLWVLLPVANASNKPSTSGSTASMPMVGAVKELSTADPKRWPAIAQAIKARHDTTVLGLETIVTNSVSDPRKYALATTAINLLGSFHAVHSVDLLSSHINFSPDASLSGEVDNRNAYPCVGALISIGMPAVRSVTKNLQKTDDFITLKLCAQVIKGVLGPQLALTYLNLQAKKTTDTHVKLRLSQVNALIQ